MEDYYYAPADDMSEARQPSLHEELLQAKSSVASFQRKLLEDRIEEFHEHLGLDSATIALDPNDYETDSKGNLYAVTDENQRVPLTKARNPSEFLAKSTLKQRINANTQRRLGIYDTLRGKLSTQSIAALQYVEQNLPSNVDAIPMKDLAHTASTVSDSIMQVETSFNAQAPTGATSENITQETEEETALKTIDDSPLPMREIRALDHALQNIRGELTNNLAKLTELDSHIEREQQKLTEADSANLGLEIKDRITQRLKDLQNERQARLEVLSNNREELRSQVNRIRETIRVVLHEHSSLAERIRTLFREQGITIVSVITALGFAISTLVYALTGTPALPPPPPPPSPPSTGTGWVKKQLSHLADLLKKLALKAADALPGIIGSVASWLLSTVAKVVGYMAEHLWTLALLIAGALLSKINK